MPRQFLRRASVGIGPVVGLPIWNCGNHLLGNFCFTFEAVEHHRSQAEDKLGSRLLGHSFLLVIVLFLPGLEGTRGALIAPPRIDDTQWKPSQIIRRRAAWRAPEPVSASRDGRSSRPAQSRKTLFAAS